MSGIHTYNPILVSRGSSAVHLNKLLIICTLVIFTQSGNTPTMIVCYVSHRGTKGKKENALASFVLSSWRNEIAKQRFAHISGYLPGEIKIQVSHNSPEVQANLFKSFYLP